MERTSTAFQLTAAIDLLKKRRKSLRFMAHSCASSYRTQAQDELARTEQRIQALQHRMLLLATS